MIREYLECPTTTTWPRRATFNHSKTTAMYGKPELPVIYSAFLFKPPTLYLTQNWWESFLTSISKCGTCQGTKSGSKGIQLYLAAKLPIQPATKERKHKQLR